jgi:hypothetical protein
MIIFFNKEKGINNSVILLIPLVLSLIGTSYIELLK